MIHIFGEWLSGIFDVDGVGVDFLKLLHPSTTINL